MLGRTAQQISRVVPRVASRWIRFLSGVVALLILLKFSYWLKKFNGGKNYWKSLISIRRQPLPLPSRYIIQHYAFILYHNIRNMKLMWLNCYGGVIRGYRYIICINYWGWLLLKEGIRCFHRTQQPCYLCLIIAAKFWVVALGWCCPVVICNIYCKKNTCNFISQLMIILLISSYRAVIARGMATEKQSKCYWDWSYSFNIPLT